MLTRERDRAHNVQGEAEGAGSVLPEEEKAQERPYCSLQLPPGRTKDTLFSG